MIKENEPQFVTVQKTLELESHAKAGQNIELIYVTNVTLPV